jgi:hypothetical protein
LRDDFLSLFVRGCWMVSFFFTPIYMFILIFIVSFGTKKGVQASYSFTWYPTYTQTFYSLINFNGVIRYNHKQIRKLLLYRFQHTALTSRTTVYVLLSFWCLFFFFGDSLLLITLNYNSLIDLIPSSFFVSTKSHIIFMTHSSNVYLGDTIYFFILFFTSTAFFFLTSLRYTFFYSYAHVSTLLDLLITLLIIYFSSPTLVFILFTTLFIRQRFLFK